jgi:hypothetical protein
MALEDVYRVAVVGIGSAGQELINVYHYRKSAGSADNSGVLLIDAWTSNLGPDYAALISELCAIIGFEVRNLNQPEFGTDYTLPEAIQGTQEGEMLPPQTSAVISWRTGFIGRRRRGRTYVWPAGEANQNAGQWNGPYLTLLAAFGAAATTISSGTDVWELVIYSAPDTDPPPSPPVLVTPVTSAVIPTFTASQRRRRVGVGS